LVGFYIAEKNLLGVLKKKRQQGMKLITPSGDPPKEFGFQTPPIGFKTGSKKNTFLGLNPWAISYRSSFKSPKSVNPMKSSSPAYRHTDGQNADNRVF
jgi:hypothetical protein